MSAQHTSGPWRAEGDAVLAMLPGGAVVEIARANVLQELRTDAEYANARLIAAAPELLEALRAFVAGADAGHVTVKVDNAARAAIAKATGDA